MTTHDDDFIDDVAAVTFDEDDDSVVVIVGSGAGGGTLANELAQKGIDVVVLEAGPRFKETDFENDEWVMYDKLTWRDKRAATGSSPVALNFGDAPTWVCKAVPADRPCTGRACVRVSRRTSSRRARPTAIYRAPTSPIGR